MAVRHLFDTSPHSTARSRVILGVFRGFAGPPAHLLGMSSETAYHTDFESILSLSELAVRLGVTAQTIYDLRSQGRGPHGFRIGRQLKFRASEVDAWLRRLEESDARHPGGGGQ
jgi:excisionase family DNA binding protein